MSISSVSQPSSSLTLNRIEQTSQNAITASEEPINTDLENLQSTSDLGTADLIKMQYDMGTSQVAGQTASAMMDSIKQTMITISKNLNNV